MRLNLSNQIIPANTVFFFYFCVYFRKKKKQSNIKKGAKEMNEKRGDLGEGEEDKQAMKAI